MVAVGAVAATERVRSDVGRLLHLLDRLWRLLLLLPSANVMLLLGWLRLWLDHGLSPSDKGLLLLWLLLVQRLLLRLGSLHLLLLLGGGR